MKPTMAILAKINMNSNNHKDEVFTRLFRYMLRPDLYYVAYKHLYANNGAGTRGVNDDTADGFSEAKVTNIIKKLADGTFMPTPVRRTYITKKNNPAKKRPLGIPTFTDKIVQEVLRMILEAVYEPLFLDCSHGFRPGRSCHTALKNVKYQFHGTRWFIEGDIKGCFDNINHEVLVGLLNRKIKDARLITLVRRFLKAGYIDNWQYNNTYSGTPQGGIISPLLANIYLHELDAFVVKLKSEFDKPQEKHFTYEYGRAQREVKKLRRQVSETNGEEREGLLRQYKLKRQELLRTPCKSQTDKAIKYIRYADDFLIGVNGSREDCVEIKRRLAEFIGNTLKMELSEEKTLITHSSEHARFLGYDISVRRDNRILKPGGPTHTPRRALSNMTELTIPFADKIQAFLFSKSAVEQKVDGTLFPVHRKALVHNTELEIVSIYNAELRGICNYYSMACGFHKLSYFAYLMQYSCLKTLAAKHKCHISQIIRKYKDGKGGWGIPYETKDGWKRRYFARYQDCKDAGYVSDVIPHASMWYGYETNSLESRLKAKVCELCGTTDSEHYAIHHINKVKNLKGKEPWERAMIAKRRKTLVVCRNCHDLIHKRSSSRQSSDNGEPDASRGASPVLGGVHANLPQ